MAVIIEESMQSKLQICKIYMQIVLSVYFLNTLCAMADNSTISRKPANFVPDDDLIIVPMLIEKSTYERFNERHSRKFEGARKTIQTWIAREEYAQAYGLEDRGIVKLPTEAQKQSFLQNNYLRFMTKDIERSTNSGLQDTWQDFTAEDDVDAIEELERHEKVLVFAKNKESNDNLKTTKKVKVGGKSTFEFSMQPRIELGLIKFDLESKYFDARAWVGINGNQEIKIERKFKATKTKVFANYYIDQTRLLVAADQTLTRHLKLRLTHDKNVESFDDITKSGVTENNKIQLRFGMKF